MNEMEKKKKKMKNKLNAFNFSFRYQTDPHTKGEQTEKKKTQFLSSQREFEAILRIRSFFSIQMN